MEEKDKQQTTTTLGGESDCSFIEPVKEEPGRSGDLSTATDQSASQAGDVEGMGKKVALFSKLWWSLVTRI